MDLSETIQPKSDQQNYEDYLAGPRTVTISGVTKGTTEQPVNIELAEYPGRPYKPNKTMRRLLVVGWGPEAQNYIGRRLTLVGNPDVKFGGKAVGGIEIAAMSHLERPITVALTEARGRRKTHLVEPLHERDWLTELAAAATVEAVLNLGRAARAGGAAESTIATITAKYNKLKPTPET